MKLLLILWAALVWAQHVFPGKEWDRVAEPESSGFAKSRLEALRSYAATLDTTGLMVVKSGRVVFEYGDLQRLSYLASARKSVLAMLYGKYVASGQIALSKTLRELDFNDAPELLPAEREATIEHLITARSGVYHAASNPGDATEFAPARGSQKPGSYFLYNNWDFNAGGAVFERLTGKDIYDALDQDLARPIGMQDFDRFRQRKSGDPQRSVHMAYHMWLSTRDMARFGHLMLREGIWDGKQVVPKGWTKRITGLVTPLASLNPIQQREESYATGTLWGYGFMWWVWDAPANRGPFSGAYTARGAFGQYITVLPALDLVVSHKTDPQQERTPGAIGFSQRRPRNVSLSEYHTVLTLILTAHCGARCR